MKRLIIILLVVAALLGMLWLLGGRDRLRTMSAYVENGDILTLESRHTAEEIMEAYQKSSLEIPLAPIKNLFCSFIPTCF